MTLLHLTRPGLRDLLVSVIVGTGLVACGGDSTGGTTTTTTATDTSVATDSSVTTDSATATETTITETTVTETTVTETAVTETTVTETTVTDTEPGDTTPCEGEAGCACDEDSPCDGELVCHDGACAECEDGWLGCACDDDTCESGAVCDDGDCVACAEGTDGCPCRPLGATGGVCDGDLVCLAERCVDDACSLGGAGCPCRADGGCDGGADCKAGICLGCEPGTAGCACDAGSCDQGQVCAPSNTCIAATSTCDTAVSGSVGQTCASQNKVCTTNPTTGVGSCGGCAQGFVLDGAACRPARTCADIGCTGANEVCTPAAGNADATCACAPNHIPDGDACRLAATCVSLDCAGQNRTCVTTGPEAVCTTCLGGYVDVGGACSADCTTLGCAAAGKTCQTPTGGAPSCGGCLAGWVPNASGGCVDLVTCSELTCTGVCVEANGSTGTNATCQSGNDCPDHTAKLPNGSCLACQHCDGVSNAAGATGTNYPNVGANDICVCHTEADYFINSGSFNAVEPCDADGDGWVRRTFFDMRNSSDPLVREQATCNVRKIDRFLLVPDELGGKPQVVLISDLGLTDGVVTEGGTQIVELFENDFTDDPARLTQLHSGSANTATNLRAYGELHNNAAPILQLVNGVIGTITRPALRRFLPSELNPLTKFCNGANDDYNRNGLRDVTEWALSSPSIADLWMTPFVRMSYFGELHRGFYVPPGGNAAYPAGCQAVRWNGSAWIDTPCVGSVYGTYIVQEKDRSLGAPAPVRLELTDSVSEPLSAQASYGVPSEADLSDANYWRECRRNRDVNFDGDLGPENTPTIMPGRRNADFARFNCPGNATKKGPCFEATSYLHTTHLTTPFDGRRPAGPRVNPPPSQTVFAGMNHHSQFRCMLPTTESPTSGNFDKSRHISVSDLGNYHLLQCGLNGDQATARELAPDGSTVNPRDPDIKCIVDATPTPSAANKDVDYYKWVVSRFIPYDHQEILDENGAVIASYPDYERGCIDEAIEWPFLCNGFDLNPFVNRASPTSDEDNFGHIECGCSGSGGPNCEIGCGGTPHEQIDPPYSPVTRAGYWLCGEFSLVTPVYDPADFAGTNPQDLPAGLMSVEMPHPDPSMGGVTGTLTLRGQVALDAFISPDTRSCASLVLSNGTSGDVCVTP